DGRTLVLDTVRTAKSVEEARALLIPDLIVHWHDSAFELPMKIGKLLLEAHTAARGQTGQHAPKASAYGRGRGPLPPKRFPRQSYIVSSRNLWRTADRLRSAGYMRWRASNF